MKIEEDCRGITWKNNSEYRKKFYDVVNEEISEGYSFDEIDPFPAHMKKRIDEAEEKFKKGSIDGLETAYNYVCGIPNTKTWHEDKMGNIIPYTTLYGKSEREYSDLLFNIWMKDFEERTLQNSEVKYMTITACSLILLAIAMIIL